jgi:eukaryotic-like serine/threonine-protein kinase
MLIPHSSTRKIRVQAPILWCGLTTLMACRGGGAQLGCGSPCPDGMVHIPAGTFEMGSNFEKAFPKEKPIHRVTLSAFCMDRTEVTIDAYAECVKAGKCGEGGGTGLYGCGRLPEHSGRAMNCVTWNQADHYCKQHGARLPTEAEWEYAARGTDGRLYPWGNQEPDRTRYWAGSDPICHFCPTKVGSFPAGASPFGVLDMVGNVQEWVADYYGPYSAAPQTNPLQTVHESQFSRRVQRGAWGGFEPSDIPRKPSRVTQRFGKSEKTTHTSEGFRCAKSLD